MKMILQILFTLLCTFLYVIGMMLFWIPKDVEVNSLINYYNPFKEKVFQTKAVGDSEGGYTPDNCRFVTHADNNRNTSRNVLNWEIVEKIREGEYKNMTDKEKYQS